MTDKMETPNVLTDVWRNLAGKISFYTASRADEIPDNPGVYAWFFPLNIDGESLGEIKSALADNFAVTCYYSEGAEATGSLNLGWESLALSARRESKMDFDRYRDDWGALLDDKSAFGSLVESLYVATLFCRPLYVGLTGRSLRKRYFEHSATESSQFRQRFTSHMTTLGLSYELSDLVFACVPVARGRYTKRQVELLEDMLKHLCQPPFGKK